MDAYEELVRRHQATAARVAYLVSGSWADADDIAQEAFLRAWTALGGFRPGARFRPWLLAIVANEARNHRRARGRRERLVLSLHPPRERVDGPRPEDHVLVAEERRRLLDAVNTLPDVSRLVIACRYFADLSEAETAAVVGCRVGTVKSRLARAHVRLRAALVEPTEVAAEEVENA